MFASVIDMQIHNILDAEILKISIWILNFSK